MSCIGNSGPLTDAMHAVADEIELASVLSGNRNFEGRISPDVSQNYLMAPANVVAYAIAGTVDIDMDVDPLGIGADGTPFTLPTSCPTTARSPELVDALVTADLFEQGGADMFEGDSSWQSLAACASDTFAWDETSTYVRRPPVLRRDGLFPFPAPGRSRELR